MSKETAIHMVDGFEDSFMGVVRQILDALEDDKVGIDEGLNLGLQGAVLGLQITQMIRRLSRNKQAAEDMLFVMENTHREWDDGVVLSGN